MVASPSGFNTAGLPILTDGQVTSGMLTAVDTEIAGGSAPQQAAMTANQMSGGAFATIAAAGATQGNATAMPAGQNIMVTVTASTEGVILPLATTGKVRRIFVPGSVGVKVYPSVGSKIDANATNAAVVLAGGKGSIYIASDTLHWRTAFKGA